MEYLVPVLAVAVIGVLTLLLFRWLSARSRDSSTARSSGGSRRDGGARAREVSEERARDAAARLDEPSHRTVYGHIAQGRPFEAVRDYRRATGRGLQDAVVDVQALATHPQVYSLPEPTSESGVGVDAASGRAADASDVDPVDDVGAGPGEAPRDAAADDAHGRHGHVRDSTAPRPDDEPDAGADRMTGDRSLEDELTSLTVPANWSSDPAPEDPPFEVEVMRGDESVRLSSRDLSPWLRDQLSAMVRDGNLESAAVQLSSHSDLSVPEAFEILRRMKERRDGHAS